MAKSPTRVQPVISPVTLADLPEIVAGDQVAFIDDYDLVEPEPRLPLSERLKHQIERYTNLLSPANAAKVQYLQARHPETNELMGAAMWQCPGAWRQAVRPNPGETGMGEKGSPWEGVDIGAWDAFLGDFDEGRKRHLGDKDHWYLGPIFTIPKFFRQGVASALIQHQIDLHPDDIMYLDARIEIYKTYEKKGFRIIEGGKFYRMVRWPGGGEEPKRP